MTQKNSPDEIYVEFTNKVRNVCGAIILNGYSIYYYVKFCCNDIQEALDVADWCLYEGNAGEFKETDTYKVELKKYEKMNIREKFAAFVRKHGYEPNFAHCKIQWKDDGETHDYTIKLTRDVGADDDQIFYYADGIDELESLTESCSGAEFFIHEDTVSFE